MPSLSDVLGLLCREPFNVPPDQAARLSLDQIDLIIHSDDPADSPAAPPSTAEQFRRWKMANRVPDADAERLWKARGGDW